MKNPFSYYWQLLFFRETPANAPYSMVTFFCAVALYACALIAQWSLADSKEQFSFTYLLEMGIVLMGAYCLYTYLLLAFYHYPSRFLQTMVSLLMTNTLLHLFSLPMLCLSVFVLENNIPPFMLAVAVLYVIVILTLSVWQLLVITYIYKLAMGVTGLTAMMMTLGLLAFTFLIMTLSTSWF